MVYVYDYNIDWEEQKICWELFEQLEEMFVL